MDNGYALDEFFLIINMTFEWVPFSCTIEEGDFSSNRYTHSWAQLTNNVASANR